MAPIPFSPLNILFAVRISSSSFLPRRLLLIFAPEAAVEIEVAGMVAEKAIHNVSEIGVCEYIGVLFFCIVT